MFYKSKMFTCKYCFKDFSLKHNLTQHQRKTKYCIERQKEEELTTQSTCKYCNVILSSTYTLERHYDVCKDKKWKNILDEKMQKVYNLEDELQESKKEIENLKKQLETEKQEYTKKLEELLLKSVSNSNDSNEESTSSSTTRNRFYFNYDRLPTLTTEYLVEATKDFDVNNADLKFKKFTNFIVDILKKYVICCDEARRIFVYRHPQPDGTGQLIKQEGGKKLFFYFFEICGQVFIDAYTHHHKIYGNKLNEYIKQYRDINSKLCEKMNNYCKIGVSIDNIIKLKKYDFIESIIADLAKKLHKNNLQSFQETVQELPAEVSPKTTAESNVTNLALPSSELRSDSEISDCEKSRSETENDYE